MTGLETNIFPITNLDDLSSAYRLYRIRGLRKDQGEYHQNRQIIARKLSFGWRLAIATLVWTGHAGATEGRTGSLHRLSDIVHMLAAAVWIGGIAAFSWLLFQPLAHQSDAQIRIAHRALEQFSRVGTLAVGLIVLTGIINSLSLMGLPHPYALFASRYGQLLLIKLALFAAMLVLAGANRWRLTPALGAAIANGNPVPALRGLRQSLVLETSTVLTILAVVAWMGTLEPIMANG